MWWSNSFFTNLKGWLRCLMIHHFVQWLLNSNKKLHILMKNYGKLWCTFLWIHPKMKISCVQCNFTGEDYPKPKQAESRDQELQLYNLKVVRDLWGQQLCKDIPPILLIYSSLFKQSLIMCLLFHLLTCCKARICMSSSSFHLDILLYIQPL